MSKTLKKALDILEALSHAEAEVSLTELSRALDLHPSTVHRLLRTLTEKGFTRKDPLTRKYALGFKIVEIASTVPYQTGLVEAARPVLAALVRDVQETANLVVRYQDEAIYIDQVQCDAMVRGFTQIGARAPLHCTGVGKVFLAFSSPEDTKRYIEEMGLPAHTSRTITDSNVLREHLKMIRAQGFAVDDEERELGTRCVAAPICDGSGRLIAALSISGPPTRMQENRWDSLGSKLKHAAALISLRMGFVADTRD